MKAMLLAVEPEDVTAGGVGFLVIAGLAVGTVFLMRSLNKQLKKVDFEESNDEDSGAEPSTEPGAEPGPDSPGGPDDESEAGPKSPHP